MARRAPGGGRKPTLSIVKKAKDNPGIRKLKEIPEPPAGAPPPPPHLRGEALAEWGRKTAALLEMGILAETDANALTRYCDAWARYVEATLEVEKRGLVVMAGAKEITRKDGSVEKVGGHPMQNPWLPIANKASDQMYRLEAEFGLTPVARERLSVKGKPKDEKAKRRERFYGKAAGS